MDKYDALSKRLADQAGPEWRATFAEIEEVLGFPLPKSARAGRGWWDAAGPKAPSRTWLDQGWSAVSDPSGGAVTFRRNDAQPSALDAALNTPVAEAAAPSGPAAPPAHEVQPEALKDASASASRQMHARSWGATAAIAAGAAVVAGIGALVVRGLLKRTKGDLPPPS
jgi:hypothetical protein